MTILFNGVAYHLSDLMNILRFAPLLIAAAGLNFIMNNRPIPKWLIWAFVASCFLLAPMEWK